MERGRREKDPSMPTWPRFPLEIAKLESRDLGIDLR